MEWDVDIDRGCVFVVGAGDLQEFSVLSAQFFCEHDVGGLFSQSLSFISIKGKKQTKKRTLEIVDHAVILWFREERWYRTPMGGYEQRKGVDFMLEDWQMFAYLCIFKLNKMFKIAHVIF